MGIVLLLPLVLLPVPVGPGKDVSERFSPALYH